MCDNVDSYLVGKNGIGFLGDRERLNVAMTRAKMALILIGDFNTLKVFFIVLVFLEKMPTLSLFHPFESFVYVD